MVFKILPTRLHAKYCLPSIYHKLNRTRCKFFGYLQYGNNIPYDRNRLENDRSFL